MTLPAADLRPGSRLPRVGTHRDLAYRTRGNEAAALAQVIGMPLIDWQRYSHDVALEINADGTWHYPDVALAVARQNGKTDGVLAIRILAGLLLWGERVLHSAQNRELPREVFLEVAGHLERLFRDHLVGRPRRANGQEQLRMKNGGSYRIIAPRQDAARGFTGDLVVLDEVREYRSDEFVSAILPTLNTSANPQVLYASNAGDPTSLVLNQLRNRGHRADPSLCWLEYSADPALANDDPEAWRQANPSLGTLISYDAIRLALDRLTPERFETEILCRWVETSGTRAIPEHLWAACLDVDLAAGEDRPFLAVDIDADRRAGAVAAAWWLPDDQLGVDVIHYATADGMDTFEADALAACDQLRPQLVAFDPWTTEALAAKVERAGHPIQPVTGRTWVSASMRLLDVVTEGRLRHPGRQDLDTQLGLAPRKQSTEGRWWLVRDVEPIPAVTAAARAVYLADRPRNLYAIH